MHLTLLEGWLFGLPYPAVDGVAIEPPEAVHSFKTGLAKCVEAIPSSAVLSATRGYQIRLFSSTSANMRILPRECAQRGGALTFMGRGCNIDACNDAGAGT
jgi:hypothetical protein